MLSYEIRGIKLYYYLYPALILLLIPKGANRTATPVPRLECKGIDFGLIGSTNAAAEFYKEQARVKKVYDSIDSENQEFRNAIRNLESYKERYKLPVDWRKCLNSIWEIKYEENLDQYEPTRDSYKHGKSCHTFNNCNCTQDREIKDNERRREEQEKQDKKLRKIERKRKREAKMFGLHGGHSI